MNAQSLFRLLKGTTLLSLALIFALISLAEGIPWLAYALLVFFLIRSWRQDVLKPEAKVKIHEILWNVLAFLYLGIFLMDILYTHELIAPVSRLLLFLVLYKVHTRKRPGEWRQLTLLGFLGLTAASALTTEFYFALVCFAFMALSLVQLSAHQLLFGLPRKGRESLRFPPLASFFRTALLVTLLTTLAGAVVFATIPREEWAYFKRAPRNAAMSGFSDQLKLGHISQVKKMDKVVFRAKTDVPLSSAHRWFGAAFNHFDGTQWSRESLQDELLVPQDRPLLLSEPQAGGRLVKQDVIIQPSYTGNLFYLPEATQVTLDMGGRLTKDRFGGIRLPTINRKTRYQMVSSLRMVRGRPVRSVKVPPNRDFLTLPDLSLRVTMGLDNLVTNNPDPWALAENAEARFRQEFEYSLDVSHINEADPIGDFLQSGSSGFCEYFATAMTLGLRRRGIPARVVTGFLPGSRSPVSGHYVVKASDAHAWVEAYIQGYGWVTFDPTPGPELGSGATSIPANTQVQAMVFDLIQLWDDHVIGFNFHHQLFLMDLYQGLTSNVKALFESVQTILSSMLGPLDGMAPVLTLGLFLLAGLMIFGLLWLTYKTLKKLLTFSPKQKMSKEGELVIKILQEAARQGIIRGEENQIPWLEGPILALAKVDQEISGKAKSNLANAFATKQYGKPGGKNQAPLALALKSLLKKLNANRGQKNKSLKLQK